MRSIKRTAIGSLLLVILVACAGASQQTQPGGLKQVRTIPLNGVSGRIDHFAFDPNTKRLFVAALGNGSVEAIDLDKGERIKSVKGLEEPQGIVYVPSTKQVVVACGGDGTIRAFDCSTLEEKLKVDLGDDADNVRLLGDGKTIVVGYGSGALAMLDATTLKKTGDVALPGHPESFQIETSVDGRASRAFVNVPDAGSQSSGRIVVADLQLMKVTATWTLKDAGRNYPMALDQLNKRLYIGCRHPAKLLVIDTTKGEPIASFDCVGDVDDIFVSQDGASLFVIGGGSFVDVFTTTDHVAYSKSSSAQTVTGARTGLFIPDRQVLYVAVPKGDGHPAEIREYELSK